MKNSHKEFIRKKILNILVITLMSFLIGVLYLGFYKADVTPIEKTEEITLTIED
jgi:hypothetical protein